MSRVLLTGAILATGWTAGATPIVEYVPAGGGSLGDPGQPAPGGTSDGSSAAVGGHSSPQRDTGRHTEADGNWLQALERGQPVGHRAPPAHPAPPAHQDTTLPDGTRAGVLPGDALPPQQGASPDPGLGRPAAPPAPVSPPSHSAGPSPRHHDGHHDGYGGYHHGGSDHRHGGSSGYGHGRHSHDDDDGFDGHSGHLGGSGDSGDDMGGHHSSHGHHHHGD
jgi:hypothetical protein